MIHLQLLLNSSEVALCTEHGLLYKLGSELSHFRCLSPLKFWHNCVRVCFLEVVGSELHHILEYLTARNV